MQIVSFLIAIVTGLVAAGLSLSGGRGVWAATFSYSLVGACALVLSLTVAAFVLPLRASPATRDSP